MSDIIHREIDRIATAKANLKLAINSKGSDIQDELIDLYPPKVTALPVGGNFIKDVDTTFVGQDECSLGGIITEIRVPDGYTSLADSSFRNSKQIQKVILPDSVTRIGSIDPNAGGCFRDSSIEDIELGAGLLNIGGHTFRNCSNLGAVVLPPSLLRIKMYAFYMSSATITGLNLPNAILMDEYAFYSCTKLTGDIILPALQEVKLFAFARTSIERILNLGIITTIPRFSSASGGGAFEYCTSLTEVHLPSTMENIRATSFRGCTSLTDVYVDATTPPSLENINAFAQCPLEHIYVPAESVEAYKAATNWNNFESIITAMPNP